MKREPWVNRVHGGVEQCAHGISYREICAKCWADEPRRPCGSEFPRSLDQDGKCALCGFKLSEHGPPTESLTTDQKLYRNCLSGYPKPRYYKRPKGIMGGPCLNCNSDQPAHIGPDGPRTCDEVEEEMRRAIREMFKNARPAYTQEGNCPRCGHPLRRQLMGTWVCDRCERGCF